MSTFLLAQLRLLENAQGDPARLALAAVDIAFPNASESEREALKQALEAAAIPHWCTAEILTALLEVPRDIGTARFAQLDRLNVVERFEARGEGAVNVHEASRLALRKRLFREDPERFRALSARAADYFAGDASTTARIESIYHRLCSSPSDGLAELTVLYREWDKSSRLQDRDALALALYDLESSGVVAGRARLEALFRYAHFLREHNEIAALAQIIPNMLTTAQQVGNSHCEANAYEFLGDVRQASFQLPAALEAYEAALRIRREVAAMHPSDPMALWQVAVANSRLGNVLLQYGSMAAALDAYDAFLSICGSLTAAEPDNVRWLRETAFGNAHVGDILRRVGKRDDARAFYDKARIAFQKLADSEPEDEDRQYDLAQILLRIGRSYDPACARETRDALEVAVRIFKARLSRAPRDLARLEAVHEAMEAVTLMEIAERNADAAEVALAEAQSILDELLAREPGMASWVARRAVMFNYSGIIHSLRNDTARAREAFQGALDVYREHADQDPANIGMQRALAIAHVHLAHVTDVLSESVLHYEQASRIYGAITRAAPDDTAWAHERNAVEKALTAARERLRKA